MGNVKIKWNPGAIKAIQNAQQQAAVEVAEVLLQEAKDQHIIPKQLGNLEASTKVDVSEVKNDLIKITSEAPYADRIYFLPTVDQDKNENAKPEWWEDWLRGSKKKEPLNLFKKLFKSKARRYVD